MIYLSIILFCLILFIYFIDTNKECFDNTQNITITTTFPDNHSKWITNIKSYNNTNIQYTNQNSQYIIVDKYYYNEYFNKLKILYESPEGYFFILVDPLRDSNKKCNFVCSYDFQTKTIGYYDDIDLYFIKSIVYSYRQAIDSIKLVKLKYNNNNTLDLSSLGLDLIITFIIPNSDFHKWIIKQSIILYGFNNIDINRLLLFYPYLQSKQVSRSDLNLLLLDNTITNPNIILKENKTLILYTTVLLIYNNNFKENFIDRLVLNKEALDPDYKCYGDESNQSRVLCNSEYDISGSPRKYWTIWDRPCKINTDCPFYKKNENYPNDRGGCLNNGYCEYPIGIKRLGYTKYNDTNENSAFCYNCKPDDIDCCRKQLKPDYAFTKDTEERKKYGLNTLITL